MNLCITCYLHSLRAIEHEKHNTNTAMAFYFKDLAKDADNLVECELCDDKLVYKFDDERWKEIDANL